MRLSATQISMYRRCSLQWAFRYMFGLKMKPQGFLTKGRAVHKGVAAGYTAKIDSRVEPRLDVVFDATSDEFDLLAPDTKWDEGEDPGHVKDRALTLAGLHHAQVMPKVSPVLVEHEMHYDLPGGINMMAYADVITADGAIRDTKTVGKRENEDGIVVDAQLAAYVIGAEAEGLPVRRVHLDRLVDTKEPYAQVVDLDRAQVDTTRLEHVAEGVARGIEAGVFHPCDDMKTCSWCGYRLICHGARWWEYLRDPELARRAAHKALAQDLLPAETRTVSPRPIVVARQRRLEEGG